MTIGILSLYIGIATVLCMLLTGFLLKQVQHWGLSFLQFFAGILFVVSGWVKAIDPLGTAYKMQQYFAAFEGTFKETALSGLAPVFPWMAQYVNGFSVGMIVLEIVLGLALILGFQRKLSAWAFFLLVVFFTILTGFTYLTGFVPSEVNFFQFSQWGPFVATNMKVTDCGCFGDFIKLEPKISFVKDLILLIPAFTFMLFHKKMHQLFLPSIRTWVTGLSIPALLLYCFSNYVWDEPHTDFRPFKVGVNVGEKKAREQEAAQNVQIIAYRLKNKADGSELEIPFAQFLKEMAKYPAEKWDMEQIKSEPAIPATKVSEFEVTNLNGQEVSDELLRLPGYNFIIIAHHLEGGYETRKRMVPDTLYVTDSVQTANSLELVQRIERVGEKEVTETVYSWDSAYLKKWKETLNPVLEEAMKSDVKAIAIAAYGSKEMIEDFREAAGISYPVLVADDILLKTIIRSNPGVLLFKDGVILEKWHIRKLPRFEEIKEKYMK